ncbi:MAG: hypothetical protein M0Q49_01740 [Porticoccaceae bacterium]|nr:hypothetical protein [Porticoccaceae bacterium]
MEITKNLETLLTIREIITTNLGDEVTPYLQAGHLLLNVHTDRIDGIEHSVFTIGRPEGVDQL